MTAQFQTSGGVWYDLRAERERICEALLSRTPLGLEGVFQARLRLIDNALDRLMSGSYGECVTCGRWIEDPRLREDPTFSLCVACEHEELWPLHMRAHITTEH
jgi:hypothetical protein